MIPGIRIALPALIATAVLDGLPSGDGLPDTPVYAGISSEGGPAAYSQVWEWGNARQTKKGPKTTLGINPDGSRAWLTIQAPYGYVRVNSQRFAAVIEKEMSLVDPTATEARAQIEAAAVRAATEIASLVRDTVPVDTHALMESIRPVGPGDSGLMNADQWSEGSFHEAFGDDSE